MMQLLCNGVYLDLYENTNLQFKRVNPLFAMDEMAAERTTQFKLPCTPTNDGVLSLARIPAYSGEGMRRKFACELQDGVSAKQGFLYVSAFDGKDYTAIVVTGMLYAVKAFDNYGWGSLVFDAFVSDTIYNSNAASLPLMARVKYHDDYTPEYSWQDEMKPSIDVGRLFDVLNTQGIIPITGTDSSLQLRLIRKGKLSEFKEVKERLQMTSTSPTYGTLQGIMSGNGFIEIKKEAQPEPQIWHIPAFVQSEFVNIPITITFPKNTPANLCICTEGGWYNDGQYDMMEIDFVGSRKFLRPLTHGGATRYEGEPLAGQTITIDKPFILATGASLSDNVQHSGDEIFFVDVDFAQEPLFNIDVRISGTDSKSFSAMLCDLSLGALIHYYSACSGRLFGQHKDGTYEFVTAITGDIIEPQLTEIKDLQRTFGSYAQESLVTFANDSDLLAGESTQVVYTIDNVNLEESKVVEELAFSEGGVYENSADNILEVRGVNYNQDETAVVLENDTAAESGSFEYMQRASLRKSNTLQTICDASTQLQVTARMTRREYDEVDSFTRLLVRGTLYYWVSSEWQKGAAKFVLAKAQ